MLDPIRDDPPVDGDAQDNVEREGDSHAHREILGWIGFREGIFQDRGSSVRSAICTKVVGRHTLNS